MTEKIQSAPSELTESKLILFKGPFPWPMILAVVLPLLSGGIIGWIWHHADYVQSLRITWILICSVLPVSAVMVVMGSIAQFKKRPLLSAVSLSLALALLILCCWGIQRISEISQSF